jgi:hypothetical protein
VFVPTGHYAALLVILTQQLASLSIDEMQPGAGLARHGLVLVFRHVFVIVHPILHVELGKRAFEHGCGHPIFIEKVKGLGIDLAQGGGLEALGAVAAGLPIEMKSSLRRPQLSWPTLAGAILRSASRSCHPL